MATKPLPPLLKNLDLQPGETVYSVGRQNRTSSGPEDAVYYLSCALFGSECALALSHERL